MPDSRGSFDAVVVGAGHNGLVTAAYLARAGLRTLVLERRSRVGGALATTELRPGFRAPEVAHTVGRLAGSVYRDLRLGEHGVRLLRPAVRAFAPAPDGRGMTLWGDVARTAEEIRSWSHADALAYPEFDRRVRTLGGFLARLQAVTPPDLAGPSIRDAVGGVKLLQAVRALDRDDVRALLRALPMAVADFVAESFETDRLRAVIASRGIQYTSMGPWSSGTANVLLSDAANNDGGAAGQTTFVRGGPGELARALADAARGFGAEIRTDADVASVLADDHRVRGVALGSGEEVSAPVVASNADPKSTLLGLVDPELLGPTLRWRARNLRLAGSVAKVNLALEGLPRFSGAIESERLCGRLLFASGIDVLERAFDASKYGRISERPYLEATLPSLLDDSLVDGRGHVMSVIVQYAPYELRDGTWAERRGELGDVVLEALEDHAPGFRDLVLDRQVITPVDLERSFGLAEGHPLHGEPSLDQFFAWRPLLGSASYRLPVEGLYLCGSGAHPGGGVTGAPGANAAREIYSDWTRRR